MPIRKTKSDFIKDAKNIYGELYDYSKVDYKNTKEKVIITCKKHGDFLKSPNKFLIGQGCRICSGKEKLTIESFLRRANEIHGDKYDYSNLNVVSKNEQVEIGCRIHGIFYQLPFNHIKGQGCPVCGQISRGKSQSYSNEDFIDSVKRVHNNKYDYSRVRYINSKTKVEIICPKHGSFLMKANSHFNGQGCPICGRIRAKKKITLDYNLFKERANLIHGNQYDYIKTAYTKYTSKMEMVCKDHGSFFQTPHSHISMFAGCPKCGYIKTSKANSKEWDVVLEMFKSVHGSRYEYKKDSFINATKKINIRCKRHGVFKQKPYQHYGGSGCPKCGVEEVHEGLKLDFNQFKERSNKVHRNKYDYRISNYIDIHTPIEILCKKHGEFFQVPRDHYRGSGCPKCNSSKGEAKIRTILKANKIEFIEQKKFKALKHKAYLRCDFYLPKLNTVIEFNGLQHYEPVSIFGGYEGLKATQQRDKVKYKFLKDKGVNLIIVRYDSQNIEEEITSKILH